MSTVDLYSTIHVVVCTLYTAVSAIFTYNQQKMFIQRR